MTARPAASAFQDNSFIGIGAGLVAVVAAGYVCSWAGFSQPTTTSVMALAIGVPASVELQIKGRHRDINVDIAHIKRGDLHRPVGLVVMLFAAAIVLLDSASGYIMDSISDVLHDLKSAGKIGVSAAKVGLPLIGIQPVIEGMCLFLVASYASHYFAKHPYIWTATAVGCAFAIRELVVLISSSVSGGLGELGEIYGSLANLLMAEVVASLGILFICMVGTWLGRRYHDEFVAKKLAHMEAKAANQQQSILQNQTTAPQASPQDSNAPQNSPANLVTLSRPNGLPSAPDNHRTSDPVKEIEKLAHLRDTSVLSEEEFQAKKTELLGRI